MCDEESFVSLKFPSFVSMLSFLGTLTGIQTSLFPLFFVSRVFELILSGAAEYTLTREDVGSRVVFTYIPVNFEGL